MKIGFLSHRKIPYKKKEKTETFSFFYVYLEVYCSQVAPLQSLCPLQLRHKYNKIWKNNYQPFLSSLPKTSFNCNYHIIHLLSVRIGHSTDIICSQQYFVINYFLIITNILFYYFIQHLFVIIRQ